MLALTPMLLQDTTVSPWWHKSIMGVRDQRGQQTKRRGGGNGSWSSWVPQTLEDLAKVKGEHEGQKIFFPLLWLLNFIRGFALKSELLFSPPLLLFQKCRDIRKFASSWVSSLVYQHLHCFPRLEMALRCLKRESFPVPSGDGEVDPMTRCKKWLNPISSGQWVETPLPASPMSWSSRIIQSKGNDNIQFSVMQTLYTEP